MGEVGPSAATSPEASLRRRATVAGQALAAAGAAGLEVVADEVVDSAAVEAAAAEAVGAEAAVAAEAAAAGADNLLQRRVFRGAL